MLGPIDRVLNGLTMYKVVLYALGLLAGAALVLSGLGVLTYSFPSLLASLAILIFISYGANEILGRLWGIMPNPESPVITGLILFFVLAPAESYYGGVYLALAALVAMTSKYVLAIRRQHVFNPAAIAAVAIGIPTGLAAWWIGTPVMLPAVAIAAFLVVRKVRRFELLAAVLIPGLIAANLLGAAHGETAFAAAWQYLASWPALFFAAFMVTEPFTSPGTRRVRLVWAACIGVLSSIPLHVGIIYSTPELTLVIGNLVAFFFGMRQRLLLTLAHKELIAHDTYGFRFVGTDLPHYTPGQYLEWTLPHQPDQRGIRRFFTIASSPTEEEIAIGVKFMPEGGSSFKSALRDLEPGGRAYASMRGGDFILPSDVSTKLAFIAGGIGVTPFRSMTRYLLDRSEKRDVVLLYASRTDGEIAYRQLWERAAQDLGMRTVRVLADDASVLGDDVEHGYVTSEMVQRRIPDWKERTFYLSGPDAMVQAYRKLLRGMGVSSSRIRTDYFPGF